MTPIPEPSVSQFDRVMIFANPIAGRGLGVQIARSLEEKLRRTGYQVEIFLQRPTELQDDQLNQPADAAVVIGGDGTLRGVAERLIQADVLPPLLTVPLGTANLMGQHLGIHWKKQDHVEDHIAAAIQKRQIRPLDAGRANGRLLLLMAGVGYDAQVIHRLHQNRKGPIRFKDYLLPALSALREHKAVPLRVEVDGRVVFSGVPALAFVGNLSEYGTGFPVVLHATPTDGLLDVYVVPCRSRSELVRLFLMGTLGEHTNAEGAFYGRGKHVKIESPVQVPVQVDGDPAGNTPVVVDLLPVRLPFIVP